MLMEFNRISSHLQGIGPMGMELGATTIFLQGLRMRERILDLYELITGLRMNDAYIRPGGLSVDLPADRGQLGDDPVMIKDAQIGWPARLSRAPGGLGPAAEHIAHIMSQSMEALIHHFKLVTDGFRVPAGQAYVAVESARGELG